MPSWALDRTHADVLCLQRQLLYILGCDRLTVVRPCACDISNASEVWWCNLQFHRIGTETSRAGPRRGDLSQGRRRQAPCDHGTLHLGGRYFSLHNLASCRTCPNCLSCENWMISPVHLALMVQPLHLSTYIIEDALRFAGKQPAAAADLMLSSGKYVLTDCCRCSYKHGVQHFDDYWTKGFPQ